MQKQMVLCLNMKELLSFAMLKSAKVKSFKINCNSQHTNLIIALFKQA